ncbi:MAG: phosphoethanolamine transferase, partial [Muribaculaceae bacterium]|nr:phosphoethanolamine transferase [Muribaculaceae bacterium]
AFLPALLLMVLRGAILIGSPGCWRRTAAGAVTTAVTIPCMTETWLSFMLHTRWSDRIIRLIADTNPGESGEFLNLYLFTPKSAGIIIGYLATVRILYVILKYAGHKLRLTESASGFGVRRWIGIIMIAAGIVWWSLPAENNYNAENSLNTFRRLHKMLAVHNRTLKNIKALEKTPSLADGRMKDDEPAPEHIIWVIGESDSKAHWSLYGYSRSTTPEMERLADEGNLLKYEDVICFEPRTYRMMEILFTPYVVREHSSRYLKTPLTPMILRKAGYKVRLHDNQATLVRGDDQAEVGTSNFMNSRVLSKANFDYRNELMYTYDMDLIEAGLRIMDKDRSSGTPTMDIFHLNGQHFSAANRYPEGFGKFTAADYSDRKELSSGERGQVAAYDNATLYVDRVLSRLMEAMKEEDAVIIYHPDHGEEMNDERHCHVRTMDSHKLPQSAPYVLEIPFLVYTTPLFRERHPDLYSRLQGAAAEKQSLIYFSHFLLDVAGVESKYKRPEYSPLSPQWSRPSRIVKEIGNYDRWKEKHIK